MQSNQTICVYCGSSDQVSVGYHDAAREMGHAIAAKGYSMVYGGGGTGLMGAVADAALAAGASVIGVIPDQFNNNTLAHEGLTKMHVVRDMHARKTLMAELADAFIALPGGFGTLEELFEILTWAQIGLHQHPVGVLNVNGYYDPLLAFIDHARREGFLYVEHPSLLLHASDPTALLEQMIQYKPPMGLERWVNRPAKPE